MHSRWPFPSACQEDGAGQAWSQWTVGSGAAGGSPEWTLGALPDLNTRNVRDPSSLLRSHK